MLSSNLSLPPPPLPPLPPFRISPTKTPPISLSLLNSIPPSLSSFYLPSSFCPLTEKVNTILNVTYVVMPNTEHVCAIVHVYMFMQTFGMKVVCCIVGILLQI